MCRVRNLMAACLASSAGPGEGALARPAGPSAKAVSARAAWLNLHERTSERSGVGGGGLVWDAGVAGVGQSGTKTPL